MAFGDGGSGGGIGLGQKAIEKVVAETKAFPLRTNAKLFAPDGARAVAAAGPYKWDAPLPPLPKGRWLSVSEAGGVLYRNPPVRN